MALVLFQSFGTAVEPLALAHPALIFRPGSGEISDLDPNLFNGSEDADYDADEAEFLRAIDGIRDPYLKSVTPDAMQVHSDCFAYPQSESGPVADTEIDGMDEAHFLRILCELENELDLRLNDRCKNMLVRMRRRGVSIATFANGICSCISSVSYILAKPSECA